MTTENNYSGAASSSAEKKKESVLRLWLKNRIKNLLRVEPRADILICLGALIAGMIWSYEWKERIVGMKTISLFRFVIFALTVIFFVAGAIRNGKAKKKSFGVFLAVIFWGSQLLWALDKLTDARVYNGSFHEYFNLFCHGLSRPLVRGMSFLTDPLASAGIPAALSLNVFCFAVFGLYLYVFVTGKKKKA